MFSATPAASQDYSTAGTALPETQEHTPFTERLVFVLRDRKCPMFRGTGGVSINDWVKEAQACMRAHRLSLFFYLIIWKEKPGKKLNSTLVQSKETQSELFRFYRSIVVCSVWL